MNPPAEFRSRFHTALCEAFDVPGLRRFCDYSFTVNASEINWNDSPSNVVSRLMELAMQEGRFAELVWRARLARPRRPDLAALWAQAPASLQLTPQAVDTLVQQGFVEQVEAERRLGRRFTLAVVVLGILALAALVIATIALSTVSTRTSNADGRLEAAQAKLADAEARLADEFGHLNETRNSLGAKVAAAEAKLAALEAARPLAGGLRMGHGNDAFLAEVERKGRMADWKRFVNHDPKQPSEPRRFEWERPFPDGKTFDEPPVVVISLQGLLLEPVVEVAPPMPKPPMPVKLTARVSATAPQEKVTRDGFAILLETADKVNVQQVTVTYIVFPKPKAPAP